MLRCGLSFLSNLFCALTDMMTNITYLIFIQVHRIVVVDENDHVIGMISLSDILSFLTLKPVLLERADLAAVAATIAAAVKAKETHTLVEESEDEEEEEEESDAESESDHGGDGAPAVLESPVKSERLTTTIEKLASTKLTSNTRNEDDDKEDDVFSLDDGGGGGHTMCGNTARTDNWCKLNNALYTTPDWQWWLSTSFHL